VKPLSQTYRETNHFRINKGEGIMAVDSKGNDYREIDIPGGNVRITYIQSGWADSPSVRIQIRDENGHLRQGPEIPLEAIGGVVGATVELVARTG
jgi:hypothetical protein